jgi:microcystin-dependent protein
MAEPYLGEIRMFGGNFAPNGWALCNGQLLSISQNTALFSLLGTTYGGDGVSNFALPNLQGRVPIHAGQGAGLSPYTQGQSSGSENVTLIVNQMPVHNHAVSAVTGTQGTTSHPNGQFLASSGAATIYNNSSPDSAMSPAMIQNAGGNQPHSNIQPYLCVTFIIAMQGIYPSRN